MHAVYPSSCLASAHRLVGAVALALLFGLFNLIYGTWELVLGIDLRHTSKKVQTTLGDRHLAGIGAKA